MSKLEVQGWLKDELNVPRETLDRLERFVEFLSNENERQNLVSRGTIEDVWTRHILDSAQLLRFAPSPEASWIDLGTGAGFPGLIVAALHSGPVTLVEQRRMRVEFLQRAGDILELDDRVRIEGRQAERLESGHYDVISARAFAPLDRLLEVGHRFSTDKTRFVLPKGRNAASELEAAMASWQGEFRLEQSLTDDDARIIVAERVSPKAKSRPAKGRGVR